MRGRDPILVRKFLLAVVVLMLMSAPALAYIGPGPGLEFVGYFWALAAVMATAFWGMLLWPFYALMRWLRPSHGRPTTNLSVHLLRVRPSESGLLKR